MATDHLRAPLRALPTLGFAAGLIAIAAAVAAAAHLGLGEALPGLGPALAGAAVGLATARLVRALRLSRPRLVVAATGVAALAALGAWLALDYRTARAQRLADLDGNLAARTEMGALDAARALAERHDELAQWSLARYAAVRLGWLDDGPRGMRPGPASLGRAGSLARSLAEVIAAVGLAALLAVRAARRPVCPRCGRHRQDHALGELAAGQGAALAAALRTGGPIAPHCRPRDTAERVRLTRWACPAGHDGAAGVLEIVERRFDRKRRLVRGDGALLDVSAAELAELTAALAEPAA